MSRVHLYSTQQATVAKADVIYGVPFSAMRVHDAMQTVLPAAGANDDMGLVTGTPGTAAPSLRGVDFGGTATDEKAAFEFFLPPEYVAGTNPKLRVRAGMITTVSDTACSLDVECWSDDGDATVSADRCITAQQSINSLTLSYKTFEIDGDGLVPGSKLLVRLGFVGADTGNAGVMFPAITELAMLLEVASEAT